jgi:hypothetical protein
MTEAVSFMRQVTEFIANNPNHSVVVDYNKGNVGLGYIIRNWKEINNENNSNKRQRPSGQDNPS